MSKYRKLPIEIEAVQFTRKNIKEIEEFTDNKATDFTIEKRLNGIASCKIATLEGIMTAVERDYIIKGINR